MVIILNSVGRIVGGVLAPALEGRGENRSKLKMIQLAWNFARTKVRVCRFRKCITFLPPPLSPHVTLWCSRQSIFRERNGVGRRNLIWMISDGKVIKCSIYRRQEAIYLVNIQWRHRKFQNGSMKLKIDTWLTSRCRLRKSISTRGGGIICDTLLVTHFGSHLT